MSTKLIPFADLLSNDRGRGIRISRVGRAVSGSDGFQDGVTTLGGSVALTDDGVLYTTPRTSNVDAIADTFTYVLVDATGTSVQGTVTVRLSSVVIATEKTLASASCGQNRIYSASDVLTGDRGTALTLAKVSNATLGSANLLASGASVTFAPQDCASLQMTKTIVTHKRFVQSTVGPSNTAVVQGLAADVENLAPLEAGDYAIMTTIRLGDSTVETGWTLLADTPQAKVYYRALDAAYVARHKSTAFASAPYPFVATHAGNRLPNPIVRVYTFPVPKNIAANDTVIAAYAHTHIGSTSGSNFNYSLPRIADDFYRNVFIEAYGPNGEAGGGSAPVIGQYTTQSFSQVGPGGIIRTDGNKLTFAVSGDTAGADRTPDKADFSESVPLTQVSNVYATTFALREVPRTSNAVVVGGFNYLTNDKYGVSDTGRANIPISVPVNPNNYRVIQAGGFINVNGFCGVPYGLTEGNYILGVMVKENEHYGENPSGDEPLDPLAGWTVIAKSNAHPIVACTIAYRRVDSDIARQHEIRAYRDSNDLFSTHMSFMGVEIAANPGEAWANIIVSAQATATTFQTTSGGTGYIAPKPVVPDGCSLLTFLTSRPGTTRTTLSDGNGQLIYEDSYNDNPYYQAGVVHESSTRSTNIVRKLPNNAGGEIHAATITIVMKDRK